MKIVLLDRDGTLIADPPDDRVDSLEKVALFSDTIDALKLLAQSGFSAVIITNQAGIAEGRLTKAEFDSLHQKILQMLAPSGIVILKTYMCPHGPEDNCVCRKPKPTLILRAAKEFAFDLQNTYMVGDREGDIAAGLAAGAKTVLVKTARIPVMSDNATYTAATLLDAVRYIVGR
jgi:D-glycero-D-manno-heptose 1,7-bisphosphate phosphatase